MDGREITDARHITVLWDPAVELDDIRAKRKILDLYEQREYQSRQPRGSAAGHQATGLLLAIRQIAYVHSGHADYQSNWDPT